MTREFAREFGGRHGEFAAHGFQGFRDFHEKWEKLSTEEKVNLIDERVETMRNQKFLKAFMGKEFSHPFGEKWTKMSQEEKADFLNKRSDRFKDCSWQTPQELIAAIDKRCEEWMKKSPEEKETAVKERLEHFGGMHDIFNFWEKSH